MMQRCDGGLQFWQNAAQCSDKGTDCKSRLPQGGVPFDGREDLLERGRAMHLWMPLHRQHAAAGRAPDVVPGVADDASGTPSGGSCVTCVSCGSGSAATAHPVHLLAGNRVACYRPLCPALHT